MGIMPATQVCALTWNRTMNLLVNRTMNLRGLIDAQPLSHTDRAVQSLFLKRKQFCFLCIAGIRELFENQQQKMVGELGITFLAFKS